MIKCHYKVTFGMDVYMYMVCVHHWLHGDNKVSPVEQETSH